MPKTYLKSRPYLKFAMAAALAWTVGAVVSVGWNLKSQAIAVESTARAAARTAFEKDVVYRKWNSIHGGVYVPVSPYAEPNIYLEGVVDRDIETTGGKRLTLMNPAYMNRQVHEIDLSRTGSRGHLTSLRPLRPENAPDEWEREALQTMVSGREEYSGVQILDDGREYMRLMRPLITEEACLKCHEQHGYTVGQIRGGLSVSTPMEPFREAVAGSVKAIWSWHLFTWIIGIAGIVFSADRLNDFYRRQERSEQLIRASLQEKEVLLREIHHRVKNNLQVISGMLELQAALVKDPSARTSLQEGRNRVMSMALIHQKLYQSQDMAQVRMDSYVQSLVGDLFSAFGVDRERIAMKIEAEAVRLNLDVAIPFGLLVSELVTNAIKYAFPEGGDGEKGEVAVRFRESQDGHYILEVTDNGIGLPEGFDLDSANSLGLKLVHALVGQLGGEISRGKAPGTAWKIICPPYHAADGVVDPEPG
jgi:two-component sensor histidine kinase